MSKRKMIFKITLLTLVMTLLMPNSTVFAWNGSLVKLGSTNQVQNLTQVENSYDGQTVVETLGGKECRRNKSEAGHHCIYFDVTDSYIYNGNYPIVHVVVEYFDSGTGSFNIQYDSTSDAYKSTQVVTKGNTNQWLSYTFDITDAKFANRQNGGCDFRICDSDQTDVSKVNMWCKKDNQGLVTVSGNEFLLNGSRFVMVGANYLPPWQDEWGSCEQVWSGNYYQSAVVERDFTNMEIAGVNTIRTFIMWKEYINPSEGVLDTTALNNIKDFLQRASNHGIKIMFTLDGPPDWAKVRIIRDFGGDSIGIVADRWTNPEWRKLEADFVVKLTNDGNFGSYDSFLGYDLCNEPGFAHPANFFYSLIDSQSDGTYKSNATMRAWNSWVNAKYTSPSRAYAAWGYQGPNDTADWVYPEMENSVLNSGSWNKKTADYYTFIAQMFSETTAYLKSRIKNEALSRTLFTIGIGWGGVGGSMGSSDDSVMVKMLNQEVRRLSKNCDFISVHLYRGYNTADSWWNDQMVALVSQNGTVPVVLQEFGYPAQINNSVELEKQRFTWEKIMKCALTANADGALGWMWIDTLDTSLMDSTFGIQTQNAVNKPAYDAFCQMKGKMVVSEKKPFDTTIAIDRNAYWSPNQLYYSEGQNLVRNLIEAGHFPQMLYSQDDELKIDTIYHLPAQGNDPVIGSLGIGSSRGAVIIADTVPDFMVQGLTYPATITVKNVGTSSWSENDQIRLGEWSNGFCGGRWFLGSGETISSGQSKTFNLNLSPSAGEYNITWQMVKENVAWFGQNRNDSIKVVSMEPKAARIVSHDIPETLNAGQTYTVHITVKNEGTTNWTSANNFKLGAGWNSDPFSSSNRYELNPSETIATGQTKQFTLSFTAPLQKGFYRTDWRMLQENVGWFGQYMDLNVEVK